jgi:predicted transcriptional regulator
MVCKCRSTKSTLSLTEEQQRILAALAEASEPVACKDIAESTGIPSKSVSCRLKTLRNKGLVDSPQRCRYAATDSGRSLAAASC